jgi:hypothetical protein
VIHHGRVSVEIYRARRGPVTVQSLGETDVLGWLWFGQPYHWHLDAKAGELTRVISLDVQCLHQKCDQDHGFGYELMRRYAHHLAVQFRDQGTADIYGNSSHSQVFIKLRRGKTGAPPTITNCWAKFMNLTRSFVIRQIILTPCFQLYEGRVAVLLP